MRAATRETLVADFVMLAELLDLPEKEEQDQSRTVAAVKRWLAAHAGWLLILDNADDLPLAQEFLPTSHEGYILFTTRAQAAGPIATSVEVEQLNLQEGTLLLLRWAKLLEIDTPLDQAQAADRAAAELIAREMDGLPLALVQAGAYVEETGCSLEDYHRLYATHRKDLLARRSRLLRDYPETVATTWSLSFQQIEQANPAASDVLRLCAFLAPDAIPEELLTRGATELGVVFGAATADPFKLNETLGVLRRYSLVRRNGSTHMLSIHRLVQAVLKESMDQETQRAWAERTVRVVNAAFPETDSGTDANHQSYLPHVQECATLITQYHLHFPEAARLLYQAGDFLYFHGFYPQSQSLHQQALAIREQMLGSDNSIVAESLNALAVLARLQGDYEQAEGFHQQALAIREKTLGPDHFATALSLSNLGVLYRSQGKYEQAEPLLRQALSIREQLLGSEHPDTLITFINLAKLYSEQRKYEQAEQLLQQALAISERVLKPGDPLIAHNLNLLARLLYEQGNHERAETLWQRSLAILEKTLGPEHPATAERLNDLAELSFAQGRYTEAQFLCQRALNICEKILGSEHPDTISVRKHLTRILSKREAEQDNNHHPAQPPF
jgi:tetratricopeptide (TPR) repeat protein